MKKSILFYVPDYHCSFFYREHLRRLGWKADIYVPPGYPDGLLYSDDGILRRPRANGDSALAKLKNKIILLFWTLNIFRSYNYIFFYGKLPTFSRIEKALKLDRFFGPGFSLLLSAAKIFSCKMIYLPTGCLDEELKENYLKFDDGNVCGNCGWGSKCDDNQNRLNFERVRRYASMAVGSGFLDSSQFKPTHIKYKSLDLDLWKPNLHVPKEFTLPPSDKLRILHSFYSENRGKSGRNIKGSPFVVAAVDRLREEGYPVEYIYFNDVPSRLMRFYQVQVDIVVDQLIYGWWGSTSLEAMALGKPVVCYLRPSWKSSFRKHFPEYESLPIVEANTQTIYDALKELVVNEEYRHARAAASRRFAETFLDARANAEEMSKRLLAL